MNSLQNYEIFLFIIVYRVIKQTVAYTYEYLGGWDFDNNVDSDKILEFDPLTEKWDGVGSMLTGRSSHEVSVIQFDSGLIECLN